MGVRVRDLLAVYIGQSPHLRMGSAHGSAPCDRLALEARGSRARHGLTGQLRTCCCRAPPSGFQLAVGVSALRVLGV